jgi:hypothetical protein
MWVPSLSIALVFAASVQGAAVVPRDGASIDAAIQTVSTKIVTLNETVTSFESGLLGTFTALKILGQSADLDGSIKDATRTAEHSAALSDAESETVATSVLLLAQTVYGVLDNIVAKKPEFDKAILGVFSGAFLVKGTLEKLQTSTNNFGDALTPKLTEQFQQLAPIVLGQINDRFDQALEVYQ